MRAFADTVPRWPALAGVASLAGAAVVAAVAPLLAAAPAVAAGAGRTSPAVVLLAAALTAGGIVLLVTRVAGLTRPVSAEQLGLRAPRDVPRALLLAAAAAAVLVGLAALWHPALAVPAELDARSATAQAYDLPVREPAAFGPALLASALAHCVLPVVAGEILVRGFAFPALATWRGPLPAAMVVSVVSGGLTPVSGVAALSLLLGLGLCGLYAATGSLLPGIALAALASAAALGTVCALPGPQVAGLALLCAAAAVVLAGLRPRPAAVLHIVVPRRA